MTISSKRFRTWILGVSAIAAASIGVSACEGDDSGESASLDAGAADEFNPIADARPIQDVTVIDASTEASVCTSGSCAVAIAANGDDSCALTGDGTVKCWGDDGEGQIGFVLDAGPTGFDFVPSPTVVAGVSGVSSISIGGYYQGVSTGFICALLGDAGVSCWGDDTSGDLGRGDAGAFDPNPAPALVSNPVAQISVSGDTACGVYQNGNVACWGSNDAHAIDPAFISTFDTPTTIAISAQFTQVSVGVDVCAVSTDNHVWCWGRPTNGGLGRSTTDGGAQDYVAAQVQGLEDIVQVASGHGACALSRSGIVSCWGGAGTFYGTSVLGRGDVDSGVFDPTPAPVVMPSAVTFTQIVAEEYGFCALAKNQTVWCWGNNFSGSEGAAYTDGGGVYPVWIPTQIPSLAGIVQIASGASAQHACALDRSGVVRCWGYNGFDQLGTSAAAITDISLVPLVVTFP